MHGAEGTCSASLTPHLAHDGPPVMPDCVAKDPPTLVIHLWASSAACHRHPLRPTPCLPGRTLQICASCHYQMLPHPCHPSNYPVKERRLAQLYLQMELSSERLKVAMGLGPELQLLVCICPVNFFWVKGNKGYKSPSHSKMHCQSARE